LQLEISLDSKYATDTYVSGPYAIFGTNIFGETTLLVNNVTKLQLVNGYIIENVSDNISGGTISS